MKRKVLIGAVTALVLLIGIGGYGFWKMMRMPLYNPGYLKTDQDLRSPLKPPIQSSEAKYWQVAPDIQLNHFSHGSGRNVLIVHGGPGYPYLYPWTGLNDLTKDFKFHYYDQRGAGKSTRPINRFTSDSFFENVKELDRTLGLAAQIADIERIRNILGDDKLIIIGHSFGGFLASMYAAEFPEHIEALVLLSPADVLKIPQDHGGLFPLIRERLPEMRKSEFDAFLKDYLNFKDIFNSSEEDLVQKNLAFGRFFVEIQESDIVEQARPGGWMVFAMYFSMGMEHDYVEVLNRVQAPALIIHGSQDLQSVEVAKMYAKALPNAEVVTIEKAAHFAYEESPEEFSRVVQSFLNKL